MLDPVYHALADPTRREILSLLREGDRSTGVLSERFALSRPTVSKHLRVLLDAELVSRRKKGRNQLYSLRPQPLSEAYEWIGAYQEFWRRSLANLKLHLEEEA